MNNHNEIFAYVLLVLFFVLAGYNKIFSFNNTSNMLQKKVSNIIPNLNLPNNFYQFVILLVIILELIAPLIPLHYLIYQDKYMKKYAKLSIYLLIIFTILATGLFHLPATGNNYYSVMSNISTIGGLAVFLNYINKMNTRIHIV